MSWDTIKLITGITSDVVSIIVGGAAIWHIRMYLKNTIKKI